MLTFRARRALVLLPAMAMLLTACGDQQAVSGAAPTTQQIGSVGVTDPPVDGSESTVTAPLVLDGDWERPGPPLTMEIATRSTEPSTAASSVPSSSQPASTAGASSTAVTRPAPPGTQPTVPPQPVTSVASSPPDATAPRTNTTLAAPPSTNALPVPTTTSVPVGPVSGDQAGSAAAPSVAAARGDVDPSRLRPVEPGGPLDPLNPPTFAAGSAAGSGVEIAIRFESRVADVSGDELASAALAVLNDERGWPRAGFRFVADPSSWLRVVLAEGWQVDQLCLPLRTGGTVSCQNGSTVALNANRWRSANANWDSSVDRYREYLVNHEVGHLIGQRHPSPRCPVQGGPAAVMEQQTGGLAGCVGNGWPRAWEINRAAQRPVVVAPDPAWGPAPTPLNEEA